MRSDPQDPEAWHDYAEADLQRRQRRFTEGDLEDCIFHLQQCAEKCMKGKLIALGWTLERTHNLIKLADELRTRGIDLNWFAVSAGLLLAGYIGERHPGLKDEAPENTEVKSALDETARLFAILSGRTVAQ